MSTPYSLRQAWFDRLRQTFFDKLRLVRRGLRVGMTNQAWGGSSLSGEGISFAQVLLSILVVAVPVVLYFVFREEVLALAGLAALLIALNWLWSSAGAAGKVIVVLVGLSYAAALALDLREGRRDSP